MRIGDWGAKQARRLADRLSPMPPTPPAPVVAPGRVVRRSVPDPKYVTIGASTEQEAAARYAATKELDPFPAVPPALLNSAHIEDYMLATAMVFPYQRERRKSASYAMRIGAHLAFHDPSAPEQGPFRRLDPFESFTLPPNSLVYVQTKELFQLPNYMAVRFNLHIEMVHKGLLLGTGPLVDPGFSGRLVIPLHNMTANTYVLAEDDEVIWVEFTKTSPNPDWLPASDRRGFRGGPRASFARFPSPKTGLGMLDYFDRARGRHESRPDAGPYPFPANAIPGAVEEARTRAGEAERQATRAGQQAVRAAKTAGRIRNVSIVAGLVAGAGILFPVFSVVQDTLALVQTTSTTQRADPPALRSFARRLDALQRDAAAHDLAEVRLLTREYCAVAADRVLPLATERAMLARLRLAEIQADRSWRAATGRARVPAVGRASRSCGVAVPPSDGSAFGGVGAGRRSADRGSELLPDRAAAQRYR